MMTQYLTEPERIAALESEVADLEARLAASERRARVLDDAVYRMCLRIAAEHGMNSAQMLKVRDDAIAESEEGSDE